MSADKYPSIFLRQMEAIVYLFDALGRLIRFVYRESRSRKAVSFEDQVMSEDKYPSIFSHKMEAFVLVIF